MKNLSIVGLIIVFVIFVIIIKLEVIDGILLIWFVNDRVIGIVVNCGKVVNISFLFIFKILLIIIFIFVIVIIFIIILISIDKKFFISIFCFLNRGMVNVIIVEFNKFERMFFLFFLYLWWEILKMKNK